MVNLELLYHTTLVTINFCEANIICLGLRDFFFFFYLCVIYWVELLLLTVPAAALPKRLLLHRGVCVHVCACTPLYKVREKQLLQMSFGNDVYWRRLENVFFSKPTDRRYKINTVEQDCINSKRKLNRHRKKLISERKKHYGIFEAAASG